MALAPCLAMACHGSPRGEGDRDGGVTRCTLTADAGATFAAWVLRTPLDAESPHVLIWDGQGPRLDGAHVDWVDTDAATFVARDAAGRRTTWQLCPRADEVSLGTVNRCGAAGCEQARVTVEPLTDPALRAVQSELPIGEYQGADWPPGVTIELAVMGNTVALARGGDGLRFLSLDASSPPAVSEVGHLRPERDDFYADVRAYRDGLWLVASADEGLLLVDASQPSRPFVRSSLLPALGPRSGHNAFLVGDRAYLARPTPDAGVTIVDVEDSAHLAVVTEVTLPQCADVHDLSVRGATAVVNCLDGKLRTFDISDPNRWLPRHVQDQPRSHSSWITDVGQRALVLSSSEGEPSGIELAWLNDDQYLTPVGWFALGGASSVHTFECRGSECLVSAFQAGWFTLDVSDPERPWVRAAGATWLGPGRSPFEGATGIARFADWILVADTERGLLVYAEPAAAPQADE